jgi:3-oxochol-4-en-24-oyl-CoA dehydrogenase
MATAEQEALALAIAGAFPDLSRARHVYDGDGRFQPDTWSKLGELGLVSMLVPEAADGGGGSLGDAAAALEQLARVALPAPVSSAMLASVVLADSDAAHAEALLRELIDEHSVIGVATTSGEAAGLSVSEVTADTAALHGQLGTVLDGPWLDVMLVYVSGSWWAVSSSAPGVTVSATASLDLTRPLARVDFDSAPVRRVSRTDPAAVERLAWVLLAAEATGVAAAALDLATEYAKVRTQFGQVIGRFQAIKHKLVDALVAVEGARSAVFGAVLSAGGGVWPEDVPARIAKAVSGEAAARVTRDAVQVHGAIGNTWEHDLHLLVRRAKSCQLAFGSPDHHRFALVQPVVSPEPAGPALPTLSYDLSDIQLSEPGLDEFLAEMRAWLDENVTETALEELHSRDRVRQIAARRAWQARLAEAGLAGIHWPAQFGGRDASLGQQILYHQELALRNLPPLIGNRGLSLVGPTLIVHGSGDQKQEFVERTRRADVLWASGLSEREAGSDLAGLRTRGELDGTDVVINGHKIWTTSAQFADWIYCLVRTGESVPKHEGITCILVPLSSPGITVRPIRRMTGYPDFNEVFFDDVRVPITNVVGELNRGWSVARTTLSHEHMTNFLGTQMRLSGAVQRVLRRLQSDRPASEPIDPYLGGRVVDAWVDAQLLSLHGLRNVSRVSAGQPPGPEGSILKLFGQELEQRLFELGLDAGGSDGLRGRSWATTFLATRASTVGGGTSEVHRNKIAERVLGLPRDVAE